MVINFYTVWQIRLCIIFCIYYAFHGVAGMIGLLAWQSPNVNVACTLMQEIMPV